MLSIPEALFVIKEVMPVAAPRRRLFEVFHGLLLNTTNKLQNTPINQVVAQFGQFKNVDPANSAFQEWMALGEAFDWWDRLRRMSTYL